MLASRLKFQLDLGPVLPGVNAQMDGSIVEAVRIDDVRISLEQTWALSSLEDPSAQEDMPMQSFLLWSLHSAQSAGTGPLSPERLVLAPEQPWGVEQAFLLPDDAAIRPSVSPQSKTGLKVTHRLTLVLKFTPLVRGASWCPRDQGETILDQLHSGQIESTRKKEVVVSMPVVLSTCACVVYALLLPAYGEAEYEDMLRHQKACDERNRSREDRQHTSSSAECQMLTLHCILHSAIQPVFET